MNQTVLNSKTFDEWCASMDCNGYSYMNHEEIATKSDNPCYIAENAEELSDIQSYQDMKKEAEEWITENGQDYCDEVGLNITELTPDYLIDNFFDMGDTWVFFSTFLDELNN